ncbi:MAG: DUF3024 domain-containing protein [Thermoanaerobaculia bacterium]|nr:DUF3024 domain-containing protein [Thermoanaerobaculia bacterium]
MPISEIESRRAEKVLRDYCARRTDPAIRDMLEIVYRLEGNYAYISERRPDWRDRSVYRDEEIARFRFIVKERAWVLHWLDRNLKWHLFEDCPPVRDLSVLLPVVDSEPIFYG